MADTTTTSAAAAAGSGGAAATDLEGGQQPMLSSTAANTSTSSSSSSSNSRTSSRSRRCMRVGTLTAVLLGIALLALSTVVHDHNHAARMGSSSSQTGRKPLVSILTVTYNRQQFLPKVFRLMEQQDYDNFEIVVVDDSDKSLTDTEEGRELLRAHPRVRYLHESTRRSIGAKRNTAVSLARGEICVTWDDDDHYRSHRITKQIAPILSGDADITTMAHGVYVFVADMSFYNWTLPSLNPAARSPHFGTVAFRREVYATGVRYPDASLGEDYGFAERALDAGYKFLTLDNTDGTFSYVRHANTWEIDDNLKSALFRNLAPRSTPEWLSDQDLEFLALEKLAMRKTKPATVKAVNYKLDSSLHGQHRQLHWKDSAAVHARLTPTQARARRLHNAAWLASEEPSETTSQHRAASRRLHGNSQFGHYNCYGHYANYGNYGNYGHYGCYGGYGGYDDGFFKSVDPCAGDVCDVDEMCVATGNQAGDYDCVLHPNCLSVTPCAGADDPCRPTKCNAQTGLCQNTAVAPNFVTCNDNNVLTQADECYAGTCTGYLQTDIPTAAISIATMADYGAPSSEQNFAGDARPAGGIGAVPSDYIVAVYVYTPTGGWFNRPSIAVPSVALDSNWQWSIHLPQQDDRYATAMYVALLPYDEVVPVAAGTDTVPPGLANVAVATAQRVRGPSVVTFDGFSWLASQPGSSDSVGTVAVVDEAMVLAIASGAPVATVTVAEATLALSSHLGTYVFVLSAPWEVLPPDTTIEVFVSNLFADDTLSVVFSRFGNADATSAGHFKVDGSNIGTLTAAFDIAGTTYDDPSNDNTAYEITVVIDWRTDAAIFTLLDGRFSTSTYAQAAAEGSALLDTQTLLLQQNSNSRRLRALLPPTAPWVDSSNVPAVQAHHAAHNERRRRLVSHTGGATIGILFSGSQSGAVSVDDFEASTAPVDCVVSDWSGFGACSAPCGGGTQERTRSVVVAPENMGAPCPSPLVEVQDCNVQVCVPADCSSAPDCGDLNRDACFIQANTCGNCLAGFTGDAGAANTVCTQLPVCGNNVLEAGEECDDGDTASGDGCSEDCHLEPALVTLSGPFTLDVFFSRVVTIDVEVEFATAIDNPAFAATMTPPTVVEDLDMIVNSPTSLSLDITVAPGASQQTRSVGTLEVTTLDPQLQLVSPFTLTYLPPVPHLSAASSLSCGPRLKFNTFYRTGVSTGDPLVPGAVVDAVVGDFVVDTTHDLTAITGTALVARDLGEGRFAHELYVDVTPLVPTAVTVALPMYRDTRNHGRSVPASVIQAYDPPRPTFAEVPTMVPITNGVSAVVAEATVRVTYPCLITGLTEDSFVITPSENVYTTRLVPGPAASSHVWSLTIAFRSGVPARNVTVSLPDAPAGVSPPAFGGSIRVTYMPPAPVFSYSTSLVPEGSGASGDVVHEHIITFSATFGQAVSGITTSTWGLSLGHLEADLYQTPAFGTAAVWTLEVRIRTRDDGAISVNMGASALGVSPPIAAAEDGAFVLYYKPPVPRLSLGAPYDGGILTGAVLVMRVSFTSAVSHVVPADFAIDYRNGTYVLSDHAIQVTTVAPGLIFEATLTVRDPRMPGRIAITMNEDSGLIYPRNAHSVTGVAVTYKPPTPRFTSNRGASGSTTEWRSIDFTATFDSAVTGVTAADFGLNTGGVAATTSLAGAGKEWVLTVSFDAPLTSATATVSMAASSGSIAPPNRAAALPHVIHFRPPSVTLDTEDCPLTRLPQFHFTATYDYPVTDVSPEAFAVTTGSGAPAALSIVSATRVGFMLTAVVAVEVEEDVATSLVITAVSDGGEVVPATQQAVLDCAYAPPVVTIVPEHGPSTFESEAVFLVTFELGATGVTAAGFEVTTAPAGVAVASVPSSNVVLEALSDKVYRLRVAVATAGTVTVKYIGGSGEVPRHVTSESSSVFYRGACSAGCDPLLSGPAGVCIHDNLGDGTCLPMLPGVLPLSCPPGSSPCPGIDLRPVERDVAPGQCLACAAGTAGPCHNPSDGKCRDYTSYDAEGYGMCKSGTYTNCNDCVSRPCGAHGTCIDGASSYTCVCEEHWYLANCDAFDACAALEPCQNGGECRNEGVDDFVCTCPPGWGGKTCEKTVGMCEVEGHKCGDHGTCVDNDDRKSFACVCDAGFVGVFCQFNWDDCKGNDSCDKNGGWCIDGDDSFTCGCPAAVGGEFCEDACPSDPLKTQPGQCGCGVLDVDSDGDGVPNCHDECPHNKAMQHSNLCGCSTTSDLSDVDGDGMPACIDLCPSDPQKTKPGDCGCGTPDADTDGDGTVDCFDLCPNNAALVKPGPCGCEPSLDSDGDGALDCFDACPEDPAKVQPGICGCGEADVDGNANGKLDCFEPCFPDPCENGGTCTAFGTAAHQFTCACSEGFVGATCAQHGECTSCSGGSQGQCVHTNDHTCVDYYPNTQVCPPGTAACAPVGISAAEELPQGGLCTACAGGTTGPCKLTATDECVDFANPDAAPALHVCPAGAVACTPIAAQGLAAAEPEATFGLYVITVAGVPDEYMTPAGTLTARGLATLADAVAATVTPESAIEPVDIALVYQVAQEEPRGAVRVALRASLSAGDSTERVAQALALAAASGELQEAMRARGMAASVYDMRGETVKGQESSPSEGAASSSSSSSSDDGGWAASMLGDTVDPEVSQAGLSPFLLALGAGAILAIVVAFCCCCAMFLWRRRANGRRFARHASMRSSSKVIAMPQPLHSRSLRNLSLESYEEEAAGDAQRPTSANSAASGLWTVDDDNLKQVQSEDVPVKEKAPSQEQEVVMDTNPLASHADQLEAQVEGGEEVASATTMNAKENAGVAREATPAMQAGNLV